MEGYIIFTHLDVILGYFSFNIVTTIAEPGGVCHFSADGSRQSFRRSINWEIDGGPKRNTQAP